MTAQNRADAILALLRELEDELEKVAADPRERALLDAESAILRRLHEELSASLPRESKTLPDST